MVRGAGDPRTRPALRGLLARQVRGSLGGPRLPAGRYGRPRRARPIPEVEGLEGRCWCVPLVWRKEALAVPIVVPVAEERGDSSGKRSRAGGLLHGQPRRQRQGGELETAGKEHVRREQIQGKRAQFKDSPHFLEAVAAGLDGLSREPREDSTSQYSREVHGLFLAWLPAEEADFLQASEGLGNSQKAEVAWLERKGYQYRGVDVSTWLTEDAVEAQIAAQAEPGAPDVVAPEIIGQQTVSPDLDGRPGHGERRVWQL